MSVLAAFGMSVKNHRGPAVPRLAAVMKNLLSEGGCPWDREQSLSSLKRYAVEEAHEVCDAIDDLGEDAERLSIATEATLGEDDPRVKALRDELGDLLLQVVFQSAIAERRAWFGLEDVAHAISDKLERRHPHVFGDVKVQGSGEVIANWEKLKLAENRNRATLDGIPRGLSALLTAARMGDKASRVGFDWPDAEGPRKKVSEELAELDEAMSTNNSERVRDELGDLLFAAVNLARKLDIDPEDALGRCNRRFARRFHHVEHLAKEAGRELSEHSLAELDGYWTEAKNRGF